MRTTTQSQRNSSRSRGADTRALRGATARNKDKLKHDHDARAAINPEAQQDQFGSRHNRDNIKAEQRRKGRPHGPNLAARESAQDIQPNRGKANKKGPARRGRKSSSPVK
ncbi:MAG TPA: hypothetical protein VH253_19560 [Phycisphaerae bacterium]|nr:hypothetical protein [Phycisphaerae bacterium]